MTSMLFAHIAIAVLTTIYAVYLTATSLRQNVISTRQQLALLSASFTAIISGTVLAYLSNADVLHTCTNLVLYSAVLTAMHVVIFTNKKLTYVLPVVTGLSMVFLIV